MATNDELKAIHNVLTAMNGLLSQIAEHLESQPRSLHSTSIKNQTYEVQNAMQALDQIAQTRESKP